MDEVIYNRKIVKIQINNKIKIKNLVYYLKKYRYNIHAINILIDDADLTIKEMDETYCLMFDTKTSDSILRGNKVHRMKRLKASLYSFSNSNIIINSGTELGKLTNMQQRIYNDYIKITKTEFRNSMIESDCESFNQPSKPIIELANKFHNVIEENDNNDWCPIEDGLIFKKE